MTDVFDMGNGDDDNNTPIAQDNDDSVFDLGDNDDDDQVFAQPDGGDEGDDTGSAAQDKSAALETDTKDGDDDQDDDDDFFAPSMDGDSKGKTDEKDPFSTQIALKDTALGKWMEERKVVLAKRAAAAEAKKKEIRAKAKSDIEAFYKKRADDLTKQIAQNKTEEKEFRADIASLFESGTNWEKVGKMVSLEKSNNQNRDVDRFRRLLLTLKTQHLVEK